MQRKKVKRLQSKARYLAKKVTTLQEILKTLHGKNLISKEDQLLLGNIGVENHELLSRQMVSSKTGKLTRKVFSPELRCFALTLNYYSPKAYLYVRKTFGTCLPHPRTLSKWYSTIEGRPGFTKEALNALKLIKDNNPDKKIYCALIIDEMKIKTTPEWHTNAGRKYGHVDFGFDFVTDNSEEATDALVFLLVGINTTWKVPIGYFLVKGVSGQLRARLVTMAIDLVNNTGMEIKSLTCDGTKCNIAMAEELGCSMDPQNLQTTILDPSTGQTLYFFLDPCHMLKLLRNAFEQYGTFTNDSGKKIQWKHLMLLHNLQEKELFYLANRLRSNHIYFKTKIMNVRLAAQLFSMSVADALLFCKNKLNILDFHDVTPTANFLKLINDLFDILDSKTCGYGLKKAMSRDNYQQCFDTLQEAKSVLMNLYADVKMPKSDILKRVNVLKSPRYTGFLGFCVCIESAILLYQDLILKVDTGMSFLPLHKVSQDHIEIFFSKIRSHGGSNNNPDAQQFESIYKKLLVHTELIKNEKGTNCIPLEQISILNCSSAIDKINITATSAREETNGNSINLFSEDDIAQDIESQIFLSPFGEKVIEYIAGFVVFSLMKKIKCDPCIKGLLGPCNNLSLAYQKTKGYLMYASKEVIALCRKCETIIRGGLTEENKLKKTCTTTFVVTKALHDMIGKSIFPNIPVHDTDRFVSHNVELARSVLKRYADTRISFLSKKTNPQQCVRHIYTKLIHFKNQ